MLSHRRQDDYHSLIIRSILRYYQQRVCRIHDYIMLTLIQLMQNFGC